MRSILDFLSGKKTYIICLAGVVYALGIKQQWWPNDSEIWGGLGFTGAMTLRAAITKLCLQIGLTSPAPKRSAAEMSSTVD